MARCSTGFASSIPFVMTHEVVRRYLARARKGLSPNGGTDLQLPEANRRLSGLSACGAVHFLTSHRLRSDLCLVKGSAVADPMSSAMTYSEPRGERSRSIEALLAEKPQVEDI